jgi:hypothetical protein
LIEVELAGDQEALAPGVGHVPDAAALLTAVREGDVALLGSFGEDDAALVCNRHSGGEGESCESEGDDAEGLRHVASSFGDSREPVQPAGLVGWWYEWAAA